LRITHYGKKSALLGFRKRPQDIVLCLHSLKPRLAQSGNKKLCIGLIFIGRVFAHRATEKSGCILITSLVLGSESVSAPIDRVSDYLYGNLK
jgi:hypothetical protein